MAGGGSQPELAQHPGDVFLVPELGELASFGPEDLVAGHGDRTAARHGPHGWPSRAPGRCLNAKPW